MKKICGYIVAIIAILGLMTGCALSDGAKMYDDANKVAEDSMNAIDSMVVQAFNARYDSYTGENVRGNIVKTLLNLAEKSDRAVTIECLDYDGMVKEDLAISNTAKYTVSVKEYDKEGYISVISIRENEKNENTVIEENSEVVEENVDAIPEA